MIRPIRFIINKYHPFANGLKFAWLGYLAGGNRSYDSIANMVGTKSGNTIWTLGTEFFANSFDGSADYIALDNLVNKFNFIQQTHKFTIFARIKCTNLTSRNAIMGNAALNTHHGFMFVKEYIVGSSVNSLRYRGFNKTTAGICDYVTNDNVIADANWHNVIVRPYISTYNKADFFIDGIKYSGHIGSWASGESSSLSTSDASYSVVIGRPQAAATWGDMNGQIADIMIWDRVLSENECSIITNPKYDSVFLGGLLLPIQQNMNIIYSYEWINIIHRIISDNMGGKICI